MRFAFVLEQTLGHGAHSRNLKRALEAEKWIDPTVIELTYEGSSAPLRRLPLLANWSLRASLAARASLRSTIRNGPLDAIFIHTQVGSLLSVGLMREISTVISLDATPKNFDVVGDGYGHRRQSQIAEAAKTALNRRALDAAAQLVTWNRWAADSLVVDYGVPASRVHVIAPGVDLERFQPRSQPRRPGPVRVLFVGGNFVRKGGLELMSAMALLDGAELDIVTTEASIDVPAGAACRIHRGLAPQSPDLLDLYREADIFALPSRSDCLPQALAEAAACGLPIVATRSGAMPELVHDGFNGFLVSEGSPRDLAAALRPLINSTDLRERFGAYGRQLAEREHDAARNNREIFDLMKNAAVRRRGLTAPMAGAVLERS